MFNRHSIFLILIVFVFAFIPRVLELDNRSIWMDEDRQAELAGGGFNFEMVERAAQQHQPPIDYYLESVGLMLFGHTEYGARIHAALLGSLTVVFLFLLLRLVFNKPIPVLLCSLLIVFDAFLVRYSQEGRPIACGIFFATFYLYVAFRFLVLSHVRWAFIRHFVLLMFANIGLMLSVGFGPFVFLATTAIALLPGLFFKQTRMKTCIVYLVMLLCVALAWPVISLCIDEGSRYVGEKTVQDRLASLLAHMESIKLESWTVKLKRIFGAYRWLSAMSIVLAVIGLLRRSFGEVSFRVKFFAIFSLISLAAFPAIFDILFLSQIKYGMKPRYYSMYQPVLFSGLAVALFFSIEFILSLNDARLKWIRRSLAGLFFAVLIGLYWPGFTKKYSQTEKPDWRSMYQLLQNEGHAGDVAYMLTLKPYGKRSLPYYAMQFYYSKDDPRPVQLKQSDRLINDYRSGRFKKVENIFLISIYGYKLLKKGYFKSLEYVKYHRFHRVSVLQVNMKNNRKRRVKDTIHTLVQRLPKKPDSFRAYEILAEMQMQDGELDDAARVMEDAKTLDRSAEYQRKVMGRLFKLLKRYEEKSK